MVINECDMTKSESVAVFQKHTEHLKDCFFLSFVTTHR